MRWSVSLLLLVLAAYGQSAEQRLAALDGSSWAER